MREEKKKTKGGVYVCLISKLQSRNFPLQLDLLLHNAAEIGATNRRLAEKHKANGALKDSGQA